MTFEVRSLQYEVIHVIAIYNKQICKKLYNMQILQIIKT